MDIPEQLRRRVVEVNDLTCVHPRPWLEHLIGSTRVHDALCELTAAAPSDPHIMRGICLAQRLKPTVESRDFAFVPIETELAMMAQASHLVWELDGPARRRISFATPVSFGDAPYWSVKPFVKQLGPDGAHRRYRQAQAAVQNGAPFVAATDVQRYFPSLGWSAIVNGVAYACGWSRKDVAHSIRLLGQVRMALQGRHPGLPVGLDLSSVLGTAILAQVDDLVDGLAYRGLATRWVDDITVGVRSASNGRNVLTQVEDGPLSVLHLHTHPGKTDVGPASASKQTRASMIDEADEEQLHGLTVEALVELIAGSPGPVPRAQARGIVRALGALGLDAEHEAEVLTDYAAELILGMPALGKRVRALVGEAIPAKFTDRFLISCRRTATNSGWEGEVAEQMLYLDRWHVELGSAGRSQLRGLIADRNRSERARITAGWVLARRAEEHDSAVLARLNEMSVPAARGAVGAAHYAGVKLTNFLCRQASLVSR